MGHHGISMRHKVGLKIPQMYALARKNWVKAPRANACQRPRQQARGSTQGERAQWHR